MVQTVVFNDIHQFNDLGCEGKSCDIAARRANKTAVSNTITNKNKQQYSLYPNHNDGNLTLLQSVLDTKTVTIEILNAYGQVLKTQTLQFNNNAKVLHLGKLPVGVFAAFKR